jgi:FtsP/CotA-like multicopper oxidase with cupredoxin domain
MVSRPTGSKPDRRMFLKTSAGMVGGICVSGPWAQAWGATPSLTVASRVIEVNKKPAKVFSVLGPNGKPGVIAQAGERFAFGLLNASEEPLTMHWHGQIMAPADQDRARPDGGALAVGQTDNHDFQLTPGTHWMHAHQLSEQ